METTNMEMTEIDSRTLKSLAVSCSVKTRAVPR